MDVNVGVEQFADEIRPSVAVMQVHRDAITKITTWLGATTVGRHDHLTREGTWRPVWSFSKEKNYEDPFDYGIEETGLVEGDWLIKFQHRDLDDPTVWKTKVRSMTDEKFQREYVLKGTDLND